MTSSPTRRRAGSHRTRRSPVAAVVPSLLAVLAVASLITSLAVWQGEDPSQPSAAASTSSPTTSREALSQAPSSTPATTPATTPSESATGTEETTAASDTATGAAAFDVEVVVLNQTSRAGLAGVVADRLRGQGWAVPAVGNFHGVVPATTVYFPPGEDAAARAVAESLPVTPRLKPRFGNLSTTKVTVVVTDSYPG